MLLKSNPVQSSRTLTGLQMQAVDTWETAEDDYDQDQALRDTARDKDDRPTRSKAARMKDHQAERTLQALLCSILAYVRAEAAATHEHRVGRCRIEEAGQRRTGHRRLSMALQR